MHIYTLNKWQHGHEFTRVDRSNEQKTLRVVILTAVMMGLEIAAGAAYGSMALLADGWHMGTHAAALGISLFAYAYARRHADDPRYTFGTGKISVLGGFTSAVVLQVVALLMMFEAASRLFNPQPIRFDEAILVAVLGLAVNLVSVRLLGTDHDHQDTHDHEHLQEHGHEHAQEDHNLRAAYLHVLADAMTSVLAIIALLAGRAFGWVWLDAVMGIVGGLVISKWAIGLLRVTGHILLDGRPDEALVSKVQTALESEADTRLCDLHVWRVSANDAAAIISLVTHYPRPVEHYRALLHGIPELKHITIEVHVCQDEPCLPVDQASVGIPAP
jgi:cation diffusion facilitator family transporter